MVERRLVISPHIGDSDGVMRILEGLSPSTYTRIGYRSKLNVNNAFY